MNAEFIEFFSPPISLSVFMGVGMCMHMCVCVQLHVCECVWRPEVEVRNHLP